MVSEKQRAAAKKNVGKAIEGAKKNKPSSTCPSKRNAT